MSLALPVRDVTRGQGIAFCLPLRSRPWHQAARLSWSGLLGRAAADPSLGRVTFQTGRGVTFLSGVYSTASHNPVLWNLAFGSLLHGQIAYHPVEACAV